MAVLGGSSRSLKFPNSQQERLMKNNLNKSCKLLSGYRKVIEYENIFNALDDLETAYNHYSNRPPSWPVIDENVFELTDMGNGYGKLSPMSKGVCFYRGESKDHPTCFPSIYRATNSAPEIAKIEYFIHRLKSTEFELVLRKHPAVIELNNTQILNCRIQVDFLSLAQHYGLATEYLDITNDFYVAAFFACCKYDDKSDRYIQEKNSKKGIIYYISPIIMMDYDNFNIVGLQPFHRPAEQKAFSYKLSKGNDLAQKPAVQKLIFKQSVEGTNYLFDKFDRGRQLFPYDPIKLKADEIKKATVFSGEAFFETYKRSNFSNSQIYFKKKLEMKNITFADKSNLNFNSREINKFDKSWKEKRNSFFEKIGVRRVMYPEKTG
jgi:hypothetical protein